MQKPVFRARGHDAVGLVRALGDQIVDERADIAVRPLQDHRRLALELQRRVDARHEALHSGLLIARRAVELPRAVEAGDLFALERRQKLGRVDAGVFDGVGRAHHLRMLEPRDRVQHVELHILRQAGRQTLDIHLVRVQPAGLDEQLVPGLIRKAVDLRLDRRAVARADGLDHAVEQRRPVVVGLDDRVGLFVRIGQVADRFVFRRLLRGKRERDGRLVARLQLHLRHVDRAAVDARRRAGLEPAHTQAKRRKLLRKTDARLHAVRAGGIGAVAGDDAGIQIRAGGNDAGTHLIHRAEARDDGGDLPVRQPEGGDHGLFEVQILLPLERALHILLIPPAVRLRAQGVDGRALAQVQHPVLDARAIGRLRHLAAERVELAHEMALPRTADGGIAGHIADRVQIDRKHDGLQPHPRAGQPGLDPGVARADHGYIVPASVKFHTDPPCSTSFGLIF